MNKTITLATLCISTSAIKVKAQDDLIDIINMPDNTIAPLPDYGAEFPEPEFDEEFLRSIGIVDLSDIVDFEFSFAQTKSKTCVDKHDKH